MIDFIKILSLVFILILLVRLKVNLYFSIFIVSCVFILLFKINLEVILNAFKNILFLPSNLNLILAVILITYLGEILSSEGNFKNTFLLFSSKIKNIKFTISIIPALIGLIPMPGGALFSAPMVEEGGKLINLNNEEKHQINYIFRHIWEFFWPTYPAILLLNNFFGISIQTIISRQIIYSFFYILTGYFIFLFPIKNLYKKENSFFEDTNKHEDLKIFESNNNNKNKLKYNLFYNIKKSFLFIFFENFWPIIILLSILLIFEININIIVLIIITSFFIIKKINPKKITFYFKKSFSLSTILTILSIIFFKELITLSKVLNSFPETLQKFSINPIFLVSIPPFLIGFLTGLTVASVGITFPVLKPFYFNLNYINYPLIMLSVISGFWGVMLSPVHLCFSLTREYFKASYKNVYIKLFLFFLLNFIISIIIFFLNYPSPIKI